MHNDVDIVFLVHNWLWLHLKLRIAKQRDLVELFWDHRVQRLPERPFGRVVRERLDPRRTLHIWRLVYRLRLREQLVYLVLQVRV